MLINATVVPFLGLELLRLWDRVSPFAVSSVKRGSVDLEITRNPLEMRAIL